MSSVMENRAAVFTGQPQSVEVRHAGAWRTGEMLGWRHDDSGVCQVWVRVVVGGVPETGWADLAAVRLPELSSSTPDAAMTVASEETRTWAAAPSASLRRTTAAGTDTTASLPLVRDHVGRAGATRPGGRRRAPEEAAASDLTDSHVPPPVRGRHRAPVESDGAAAGRHRAADTGLVAPIAHAPAVASGDEHPATAAYPVLAARARLSALATPRSFAPPAGLAAGLLTRPARLADRVPHSRRPLLDAPPSRS